MGLSSVLGRAAVSAAHVLVVEVPGNVAVRAAVERSVRKRGWKLATSPADADVLVVCGTPGPQLTEAINLIWQQLPGPRVRVGVDNADDVSRRLKEARHQLLDLATHRADAHRRPDAGEQLNDTHREMDHGDMDHGDMDHGDMDHGDMEMFPSGVPLARGGEDRDALEMDVLSVPLGPVLPHWPAGLVLRCSLQGDVIATADADLLDDGTTAHLPPADARARRMDNLGDLLAIAGWGDTAAAARVLRDRLLAGEQGAETEARIARLVRRVRRSWVLRWSLRGVRPLSEQQLREHRLSTGLAGDTYDRLLRMLQRIESDIDEASGRVSVDQLAGMVTGLDLATARLVLASLDLHELQAVRTEPEVSHG